MDIYGGRLLRLTPQRELSTLYTDPELRPAGVAIHRDGRIFLACVGDFRGGSVVALNPEGRQPQVIVPPGAGYVIDDLVFDAHGGFYFTDFRGTATSAAGGVHYVTPDLRIITPVLPDMRAANGVALSPDGKILWATEFCANRLLRVELQGPTAINKFGATAPYHFVGRAPDSMRTDADGNVYVAMYTQGRILVFSPNGVPIGQILLPGRQDGRFLNSTSLAFVPGSRDLVIVARDEVGGGSAAIFKARGLTNGAQLYSHSTAKDCS